MFSRKSASSFRESSPAASAVARHSRSRMSPSRRARAGRQGRRRVLDKQAPDVTVGVSRMKVADGSRAAGPAI